MPECRARDGSFVCSKQAPHPGERHTADFGAGTYTWGYEPACSADIADVDEAFASATCIRTDEHDTHRGPGGEVWIGPPQSIKLIE